MSKFAMSYAVVAKKMKTKQPVAVAMTSAVVLLTACGQETHLKSLFLGAHTPSTESKPIDSQTVNVVSTNQLNEINRASNTVITSEQKALSDENVISNKLDKSSNRNANTTEKNQAHPKTLSKPLSTLDGSSPLKNGLVSAQSFLSSANTLTNIENSHLTHPVKEKLRDNVSQQFLGKNEVEQRLIGVLPEIEYHTNNMSDFSNKVNHADWHNNKKVDTELTIKIQALLNWNNHGVGAVDGNFSGNTIKAMQAFQKAHGIKPTTSMNQITWRFLTLDNSLVDQPVLIQYKLKKEDVSLPRQWGNKRNTQYTSVREQLAEKFHMSRSLFHRLNSKKKLKAGEMITVYNPGQPNLEPVNRVEVYKSKNLLVAYNAEDEIVASYPTTIGSNSPSGIHYVANRVYRPHYNSDFTDKNSVLPPGPNNPVGLVWMGLSKPSFGIHGSPQPEMISRQRSHGCVRLTNWDALSLFGTMQHRAKVEFK